MTVLYNVINLVVVDGLVRPLPTCPLQLSVSPISFQLSSPHLNRLNIPLYVIATTSCMPQQSLITLFRNSFIEVIPDVVLKAFIFNALILLSCFYFQRLFFSMHSQLCLFKHFVDVHKIIQSPVHVIFFKDLLVLKMCLLIYYIINT